MATLTFAKNNIRIENRLLYYSFEAVWLKPIHFSRINQRLSSRQAFFIWICFYQMATVLRISLIFTMMGLL